jgi:hypothetical protein
VFTRHVVRLVGLGLVAMLLAACAPGVGQPSGQQVEVTFTPMSYYDLQVVNTCQDSLEVYIDGYYATTVYTNGVISGISAGQHELYAEGYSVSPFSRQFYFDANNEWVIEC